LGFKRGPELVKAPELDVELEIGDMIILVGPQDALANKLSSL
ncbi:TrkA family potassium uptake protein, partial [Vibrio vulnificus]|nr:TrkA family potassium uptake protein [Vibrio vulnificus]